MGKRLLLECQPGNGFCCRHYAQQQVVHAYKEFAVKGQWWNQAKDSPDLRMQGLNIHFVIALVILQHKSTAISARGLARLPISSALALEALPSRARCFTPCKIAAKRKKLKTR